MRVILDVYEKHHLSRTVFFRFINVLHYKEGIYVKRFEWN